MHFVWILFLFAIGASVGSFLNVVIYRMPRGESIMFPGSHCTRCGKAIRWYDNIPLLSWLVLRGRCRFCQADISSRYIIIEAIAAGMTVGLYICYYVLNLRDGAGVFEQTWPMFLAHISLLYALLACSMVDIEHWIVPLEVCWFVSIVGIVSATASPHSWILISDNGSSSSVTGPMAIAAVVGLTASAIALRIGLILPSFIDADDKAVCITKAKKTVRVEVTRIHSLVKPRIEIMREVLYLTPAVVLAILAWVLLNNVPSLGKWWSQLHYPGGYFASNLAGLEGALLGYLIGGMMIWGTRILGTLGFNKEAMGLGDVHILAAAGAVLGWQIGVVAFFVAPFVALIWAFYLLFRRNQRELPYGPWLAGATLIVMLFYDSIFELLKPQAEVLQAVF